MKSLNVPVLIISYIRFITDSPEYNLFSLNNVFEIFLESSLYETVPVIHHFQFLR